MDLSHFTPEEIRYFGSTPLSPPPTGVTPNFVDPPTRNTEHLCISSTLFGVGLFFYINRVYIKLRLMKTWTWDDVTLFIGLMLGVVQYGLETNELLSGPYGRHEWDITILSLFQPRVQHFFYAIFVIQPWMLLFIKATFFILYLRLFGNLRWARLSSYIGLGFTVVAQSALGITSFVLANPRESFSWRPYTTILGITLGSVGLVQDLAIFAIPLLAVSSLQLSSAKKIGAYVIFLTGGSAVISSGLNIYFRSQIRTSNDPLWDAMPPSIAAFVEIIIGVTCACIPTLTYGFRHPGSIYHKILGLFTLQKSRGVLPPLSEPRPRKDDFELTSLTSTSHINSNVGTFLPEVPIPDAGRP